MSFAPRPYSVLTADEQVDSESSFFAGECAALGAELTAASSAGVHIADGTLIGLLQTIHADILRAQAKLSEQHATKPKAKADSAAQVLVWLLKNDHQLLQLIDLLSAQKDHPVPAATDVSQCAHPAPRLLKRWR